MTTTSLRRGGIAALAAVAVVAVTLRTPGSPRAVSHVDLVNRSEFTLTVRVTDAGREGAVYLGSAQKRAVTRFDDVADQGDRWRFHAEAPGVQAGEWDLTRQELERADWRVVIPLRIAEHLRSLGLPPTP